jgi:hypothetical protein
MEPNLERVTDPSFLAALPTRSLDTVRTMRGECHDVEHSLSYVRRLAQGRLDIVAAELERRSAGGDPADLSALVGRLPEILADRHEPARPGAARPPHDVSAPDTADEYVALLDAIVSLEGITALSTYSDPELASLRDRIAVFETELSAHRRMVHDVIDALQADITRRYRTGEASVDTLLQ